MAVQAMKAGASGFIDPADRATFVKVQLKLGTTLRRLTKRTWLSCWP